MKTIVDDLFELAKVKTQSDLINKIVSIESKTDISDVDNQLNTTFIFISKIESVKIIYHPSFWVEIYLSLSGDGSPTLYYSNKGLWLFKKKNLKKTEVEIFF